VIATSYSVYGVTFLSQVSLLGRDNSMNIQPCFNSISHSIQEVLSTSLSQYTPRLSCSLMSSNINNTQLPYPSNARAILTLNMQCNAWTRFRPLLSHMLTVSQRKTPGHSKINKIYLDHAPNRHTHHGSPHHLKQSWVYQQLASQLNYKAHFLLNSLDLILNSRNIAQWNDHRSNR
jgi:hypothetical protein